MTANGFAQNNYKNNNHTGHSSMSLTIFTAFIIAIIIYTLMRMLSSKFGENKQGTRQQGLHYDIRRSYNAASQTKITDTGPLRWFDKRKPTRSNREQRVRDLILQHGGKNVSSAVRFLICELEKQKQSLAASLVPTKANAVEFNQQLAAAQACACSCHGPGGSEYSATADVGEAKTSCGRKETTTTSRIDHDFSKQEQ